MKNKKNNKIIKLKEKRIKLNLYKLKNDITIDDS